MAAKKSTLPKAQITGGQWIFTLVFETKNGAVVEGTRTELRYAESLFKDKVGVGNLVTLLRGRTRELLKRAL